MTLQELTLILVAATVCVALVSWRGAPAVTVALLSGLVGAVAAYQLVAADGPEGVPAEVAWWFSVGLVAGAIYGAATTRRRSRGTWPMRRWAVAILLLAPFACVALALSLQDACPLYGGGGLCDFGGTDVLGGWIAGVVFFFAVDLLAIVMLLWYAPGRSRWQAVEEEARPQPTRARQLALAGVWFGLVIGIFVWALTRPSELEAWLLTQPDAESFAPNLMAPAPDPEGLVSACPSFATFLMFGDAFDPERGQWLDGHVPRWLPDDFGLVDWALSEEDWDPDLGEMTRSQPVGVWADGGCRRVSLALFEANPNSPRLDRFYTVVDEVGDWAVLAAPDCWRSAIADRSCLRYVAWSYEERGEGGGSVLGLYLSMSGIDRDEGDRIALGIPV